MKKKKKDILWFPTLSHVSNNMNSNSWFDIIKKDNPTQNKLIEANNKVSYIKTFKYKIYPTDKQKQVLISCLDVCIDVYNMTNMYIKMAFENEKNISNNKNKIRLAYLRKKLNPIINDFKEKINVNKHTLDYAVKHCSEMYKSAISNLKNGNIKYFDIRNLKKDRRRKNLVLEPSYFSKKINGFCIRELGEMKSDVKLKEKITRNCILQYDSFKNEFYIISPEDYDFEHHEKRQNKCGIDIGVRTFTTIYSPNNTYEICTNSYEIIDKYHEKKSKLQSHRDQERITDDQYKKVMTRISDRMKNRINDLHKKVANLLVNKFEIINIGKISTKNMISNLTSNIKEKTKQKLVTLQHYKFREILKIFGNKYGTKINEINEYMTTQTCHNCNNSYKIGANKIYKCDGCKIELDRDINASINIYKI
jgi:putative transposase